MANVVKNPDDTFTLTLTNREFNLVERWSADHSRTKAQQLEAVINGFLQNKRNDYRGVDGPKLQDRYENAAPSVQAQVDALLPTP